MSSKTEQRLWDGEELQVLDDLIRLRAGDTAQTPLLAYPDSSATEFLYHGFSGKDVQAMVEFTLRQITEMGWKPVSVPCADVIPRISR